MQPNQSILTVIHIYSYLLKNVKDECYVIEYFGKNTINHLEYLVNNMNKNFKLLHFLRAAALLQII